MTDVQEVAVGLGGDAGSLVATTEFSVAGTQKVPALSGAARLVTVGVLLLAGAALALRPAGSIRRRSPGSR